MTQDPGSTNVFYDAYLILLACYFAGWLLFFFVSSRLTGSAAGILPIGYAHRKLKLFGLAGLWPAFVCLIPFSALALLVWISLPHKRSGSSS